MKVNYFPIISLFCLLLICISCKPENPVTEEKQKPKFSLAQWSFNKELFAGEMDNFQFIEKAAELNFDGIEFVNQFFRDKAEDFSFLDELKEKSESLGIKNVLIMVDLDEELGASDNQIRRSSIEQHKKWLLAAKYIGCDAIRINARGNGSSEEVKMHCIESIRELAGWAKEKEMLILVENHGGYSNDGAWLVDLIKKIDLENVSCLADFDNWCIERENGELWGTPCIKTYERYKGMEELMPCAKGLGVKSFSFDNQGFETTMDYARIIDIIKKADYTGYWGIEFEGEDLPAEEGVIKTRELVLKILSED